ncbi:hypothetical protein [Chryseobacterium sp.]|uniref:hypothetical protein n=1 Tax=Chryseobacterium sp. TaxID=1871047 RepID=UPI001B204E8A|nr:hypothetical protein [Chryseobacterium sp.]MBO9693599.1 hypothetical protein [Chryseobacterium sp.]
MKNYPERKKRSFQKYGQCCGNELVVRVNNTVDWSLNTNNFDLDKLSLPIDISVLEQKYELNKNIDLSGIIVYNSTDPALLQS